VLRTLRRTLVVEDVAVVHAFLAVTSKVVAPAAWLTRTPAILSVHEITTPDSIGYARSRPQRIFAISSFRRITAVSQFVADSGLDYTLAKSSHLPDGYRPRARWRWLTTTGPSPPSPVPLSVATFHFRTTLDPVAVRRFKLVDIQVARAERIAGRQASLVLAYSECIRRRLRDMK
jgi:hypothetical protein